MPKLHLSSYLSALCLALLWCVYARAGDEAVWLPVSPSELGQKAPLVEKDADAEALFWEVRADDKSSDEVVFKHYLRVKIFNERGREKFSKLEFPQLKGFKTKDIFVRVTKPDGTAIELTKNDLLERVVVKANGLKLKISSLAVPGLELGSILEYRYKQVIEDGIIGKLEFQRDIPVQRITYYVRPHKGSLVQSRRYNLPPDVGLVEDKDGFSRISMTNVPAFREEPYMPPEDEVRPWMRISYGFNLGLRYSFWYYGIEGALKKKDGVAETAQQLVANAATPEDKLARIYEFCQKQIRNLDFDKSVTDEERKKFKANKNAADVLKRKAGSWIDVHMLFIALARASGFEAYLALPADRNDRFFTRDTVNETRLQPHLIAVLMGREWRFFDPGTPNMSYGLIPWYREGVLTLVMRDPAGSWVITPVSSAEKSLTKNTGKFKLLADGALEGEVVTEFTGHRAFRQRVLTEDASPTEQETKVFEELKKRLAAAEVSNFKIENQDNPALPLKYSFNLRIPGYAQKVGKRLIFQPNVFAYGDKPLFLSQERKYSVYFNFSWSEKDNLEITLPADFELDSPDAPGTVASGQILQDKVLLRINKEKNILYYTRDFFFGRSDILLFDVAQYPTMKTLFERVNQADSHSLVLRQKGEATPKAGAGTQ
jgi:hypothetical protein